MTIEQLELRIDRLTKRGEVMNANLIRKAQRQIRKLSKENY